MSKKQDAARRANAQKSTGPRTESGKARASMNALKTGIDAQTHVLPNESPEAYQQVLAEWHGHYKPVTPATRALVDRLAVTEWFFRRYARIESTLLAMYIADHPDRIDKTYPDTHAFLNECSPIGRIQVRVNALDRTFHKDLDQLTFLQTTEADLQPQPEAPPQPTETEPDTPSAASFPNPQPERIQPQSEIAPEPTSLNGNQPDPSGDSAPRRTADLDSLKNGTR